MRLPTSPSPEAQTISAVINTGDLGTALTRGLTDEHFVGYGQEWAFLARYQRSYGGQLPSPDVLTSAYPDFPYSQVTTEVAYYADQVLARHDRRVLRATLLRSGSLAEAGDVHGAVDTMRSVSLSAQAGAAVNAITSTLVLDEIGADRKPAVAYPWRSLTAHTGGMRPGDFAVFAARTTVGKTWCLVAAAADAVLAGKRVVYFSMEMPTDQIVARLHVVLGARLGITLSHMALHERRADRTRYKKLLEILEREVTGACSVRDSSSGRISPASLAAHADADLLILDHLGLMSEPSGVRAITDWRNMASISNQVKEQAITIATPVLAASQINREGGARKGLPTLIDLAQSDAVGQDADMVLMMRRMAGPAMKYQIAKNRHGENERLFYSEFRPDAGRLREIDREDAEDMADEE